MEDKATLKKRLASLLAQRDQCATQHNNLTNQLMQLGAKINAIDGGIETARAILGEEAPVAQTPPTRQQIRAANAAAKKKKTPAKR